ncbi:hypothetical protein MAR_018572 [Mya arenaria]|uniref:Uncharacterized protein n=1 Tax=Mya arenaria TaxID=6604 RepID=A0ABY7EJN1_MYAAR|nr:hypothetical protein MAR_018572 [Mya arenaria]
MAVLETPWFMKTKTSDLGRVNQVFEDRFQKSVTLINNKQRKSLMKIDEEIKDLHRDFRRIRTDVDFATDLDEHGKPVNPDALRSKSTGDIPPIKGRGEIDEAKLRTRSAVNRSRKFAMMAKKNRSKLTTEQISELLRQKFSKDNEMQKLQVQMQEKVHRPKRRNRKKRQTPLVDIEDEVELAKLDICNVRSKTDIPILNGLSDSNDHLPDVCDSVSLKDSTRDRRFSISSPRKRTSIYLMVRRLTTTFYYNVTFKNDFGSNFRDSIQV